LNENDSKKLLGLIQELQKKGVTSIMISHKLNEINYVADRITILRDGATIETLDKKVDTITEDRIIKGMVGRELTDRFPKRESRIGDVAFSIKNWTVYHPLYSERKVVDNVSINVRRGEILGIAGLMGAGRTELAMSAFGKAYGSGIKGELEKDGKPIVLHTIAQAIKEKIAYITEDRKGDGLILGKTITDNITLAKMSKVSKRGTIDTDLEVNVAKSFRDKLRIKCSTVQQLTGNLSGGNQQKVLLSKWMFTEPDVMILDEPTRGIDVGAKYEIYCIMNDLAAEGKSIIMISSELPEILGMCDRIFVMNEGKMVGELSRDEATQEVIMGMILSASKGA
jgi:putative multiple sugar transport system ATP-binding protein